MTLVPCQRCRTLLNFQASDSPGIIHLLHYGTKINYSILTSGITISRLESLSQIWSQYLGLVIGAFSVQSRSVAKQPVPTLESYTSRSSILMINLFLFFQECATTSASTNSAKASPTSTLSPLSILNDFINRDRWWIKYACASRWLGYHWWMNNLRPERKLRVDFPPAITKYFYKVELIYSPE